MTVQTIDPCCGRCRQPRGFCLGTCPIRDRLDASAVWSPVWRVDNPVQIPAERSVDAGGAPVWAVRCVVAGLVLMVIGFGMARPVAQLIYAMIHQ